jgi:hypothetical protein
VCWILRKARAVDQGNGCSVGAPDSTRAGLGQQATKSSHKRSQPTTGARTLTVMS